MIRAARHRRPAVKRRLRSNPLGEPCASDGVANADESLRPEFERDCGFFAEPRPGRAFPTARFGGSIRGLDEVVRSPWASEDRSKQNGQA